MFHASSKIQQRLEGHKKRVDPSLQLGTKQSLEGEHHFQKFEIVKTFLAAGRVFNMKKPTRSPGVTQTCDQTSYYCSYKKW